MTSFRKSTRRLLLLYLSLVVMSSHLGCSDDGDPTAAKPIDLGEMKDLSVKDMDGERDASLKYDMMPDLSNPLDFAEPLDMKMDMGPAKSVVCGRPEDRLRRVEIDELKDCDVFLGYIDLANYVGPTIKGLSKIQKIGQGLNFFQSQSLETMEGLEALEEVGTDLLIRLSNKLQTLKGLSRLKTVGNELSISANPELESLSGLENLVSVGPLRIDRNSKLKSLSQLESLKVVKGDLMIVNNEALPKSEVDALLKRVTVQGTIKVDP